ncbi:hypothetical protein CSKR_110580 [Clonorchis sinensis]|uniref:Uncharacterized protein n=1 Tax=Clonorchis sinensis TaxID=79923 RepID=A0A419QCH5_CLOSI|nr:hypothetical protein CSKR_110580 [Clonorchis sinensis]
MSSEEVLSRIQSLLNKTHLKEDEESIPVDYWSDLSFECSQLIGQLEALLDSTPDSLNPPPAQLLILLGGILGNLLTSGKFHSHQSLEATTSKLLYSIQLNCGVQTTRQLLLLEPRKLSQPKAEHLCLQLLRLCIVHVARAPTDSVLTDPLNTRPLYRDVLIWMTKELDYPELAGEEFISTLQPLGLRLIGDYRPRLQHAGFSVLRWLASKARVADWRQNNRAEAVLFHLFEHRTACGSGSSEDILREMYTTCFDLIKLLPKDKAFDGYTRLADRLLGDLTMEARRPKQTVMLQSLLQLINIMKTDFVQHARRFIRVVSILLLGPRTPGYLRKSLPEDARDETIHLLVLRCVHLFVQLAWPIASTAILPDLFPPLIAFVDLEYARSSKYASEDENFCEAPMAELRSIFDSLVTIEARVLPELLVPASSAVPALMEVFPLIRNDA